MKNKKEQRGELIFGIHPILEMLKARRRKLISLYTTRPEPKGWKTIQQAVSSTRAAIQYVDRDVLTRMAGTTDHQGFVAWVDPFEFRKQPFDPVKQPFLVMLDGIQDPRNVGAIIRSAYCTGAHGIIITKKQSSPLTNIAIKASAGLAEHCQILIEASAASAVESLKKAGYTIYATGFGGKSITTVSYKTPLCIVIGSEGLGISPVIASAGQLITIPQLASDISYNASVAAGITLFSVATQLKTLPTE